MSEEEIVYQHYLKSAIKSRNEAIELLKNRDFKQLQRNYIHWFEYKEKNVVLKSSSISKVIEELTNIKYKENESEPILSCKDYLIEITSYIYTVVPIEKCESLAKNYANSSLWKLKHQPNGKDAEGCRKIIKNYYNQ